MIRLVRRLVSLIVVLPIGYGAVYWFVLRDTAPKTVAVDCAAGSGGTGPSDPSGTWTVPSSTASNQQLLSDNAPAPWVGYRMVEDFRATTRTAVGRTAHAAGTVSISHNRMDQATFRVDMTTLHSPEALRDQRLKTIGLQTATFPEARFTSTGAVALRSGARCQKVRVPGRLTLHGVTHDVAMDLTVSFTPDGHAEVRGQVPVNLPAYGISPPDIAGFITARPDGLLELDLLLGR